MMQPRPYRPIRTARSAPTTALLALAAAVLLAACDKSTAFGEADSLILVADEALWTELEQETYEILEPTLTTVREDRTFHVTYVPSDGSELDQLLLWRQVLVFGTPDDARVREIVDEADRDGPPAPGEIVQARDVWARGQLATAIVLEPGAEAAAWRAALPELAERLDGQFREYATSRMWVSGVDTAFAENLRERYGVGLRAPRIYHGSIGEDGRIRLRNDRPSPSDRIRSIFIERAEPGAATADASLDPDAVFAWREGIDSVVYNVPQAIERADVEPRRFEQDGAPAIEVQGVWRDEGTYPAAGPFVARAVQCPDATWFFDAWLYSPHPEDSKYEFM
ncbi:MAG: DUF4837 family protein, partial [Gemmatimonadota bacterium]